MGASAVAGLAMSNHAIGAASIAVIVIVLGLAECWFAIRTGFDASLFAQLNNLADSENEPLQIIDEALSELKLLPTDKRGRPLGERLSGAFGLLRIQGALLVAQVIGVCASIAVMGWR